MNDQRFEIKFVLNLRGVKFLESWLEIGGIFKRSFNDRIVHSVYFDDIYNTAVRDNLAGLAFRKKSRIRWYSDCRSQMLVSSPPFYEIKERRGRLCNKILFSMNNNTIDFAKTRYFDLYKLVRMNKIYKDISLSSHFSQDLLPTLKVKYRRAYYEYNKKIRLTVDSDICFQKPYFENTILEGDYLFFKKYIVEFKFDPRYQADAVAILKDFAFTPVRNSKYILGRSMFGEIHNYVY